MALSCLALLVWVLAGCNSSSSSPPPGSDHTVGGTLSGLKGSLTLRNNGGDDLVLSSDGPFVFAAFLQDGDAYAVSVASEPGVQRCAVADGSGTVSGDVTNVAVTCHDQHFFWAIDDTHGVEPWKTDGTPAGTVMLADLNPGSGWSYFSSSGQTAMDYVVMPNGIVYFAADDGNSGGELWKSDGTEAGTTRVKDIWPGPTDSNLSKLTAVGNLVFFIAREPSATAPEPTTTGMELWRSDGSEAGTAMVKNINTTLVNSSPDLLTAVGDTLFFAATDDEGDRELWKSDGTEAGTVRVRDVATYPDAGTNPFGMAAVDNTVFFAATEATHGMELWKSDGTAAGTTLVKDINPLTASGAPYELTAVGSLLFFTANDGSNGRELWKSDGTETGTTMVKDIVVSGATGHGVLDPTEMVAVGDTLYFIGNEPVLGREVWRSDGTDAGTTVLKNITPVDGDSSNPGSLTAVGSTLFFSADDGNDFELWASDGTEAGTAMAKDINSAPVTGSYPFDLAAIGTGLLFFYADDGTAGQEPWASDGTEAGTLLLKDINSSGSSVVPAF